MGRKGCDPGYPTYSFQLGKRKDKAQCVDLSLRVEVEKDALREEDSPAANRLVPSP